MSNGLGVIFDMDGVLIDTYAAHLESWQIMAAEAGLSITEEQFRPTFGRTSRESIAQLWAGQRLSPEQIAELDDRKEAAFREIIARKFPAMPGVGELLKALKAAGFSLAIGSSAPPENVELALKHLGNHELFSAVVNGSDVVRGKPDPQVFMTAAARLRMPPERCAVIEDAPWGIEAAHRAGAAAIGLASTGRTHAALAAADLIVDRLDQLTPAVIEGIILQHIEAQGVEDEAE